MNYLHVIRVRVATVKVQIFVVTVPRGISERINFRGRTYSPPYVITVANSSRVQIFVGLIFVGVAAHEN